MKQIPLLLFLAFSLSLCNLAERFTGKKTENGNSTASSNSTKSGSSSNEPVEKPNPTGAQKAALEGGQTIKWDQQGITWTLPANWRKQTVETKMFNYGASPTFIIVSISPMADDFPSDASLNAFYQGAQTRMKNGEVDEVKWLELDGVKGVQFREANPEKPDDFRRLQWMTYRKYAGQNQLVNIILSSNGKTFPKVQDTLYGVLYSTKIVQ
ncbi:MAG TPA: hypothetical protein VGO69_01110 [Pyrinomonadaceae bacterium]|jgi:hypothetical protein|nr:hypothetical protein [Pyrinomonadaceae bacterium]